MSIATRSSHHRDARRYRASFRRAAAHVLGHTAPSLYDLRNLFPSQRRRPSPVGDGVFAASRTLAKMVAKKRKRCWSDVWRRDKPRILGAFNEPVKSWLDFTCSRCLPTATAKFQLCALSESGLIRSRACKFMLTEEAHHMFVGETGVDRVQRAPVS